VHSTVQTCSSRKSFWDSAWWNGTLPCPFIIGYSYLFSLAIAQPPNFHQRWVELSTVRHPSGEMIVEILGIPRTLSENPCGGQLFHFDGGHLVSLNNESLPYVIYGTIWTLWKRLGNVDSGWGRPLADEQSLQDGGRCSIMEGGHIHFHGNIARGFVSSF